MIRIIYVLAILLTSFASTSAQNPLRGHEPVIPAKDGFTDPGNQGSRLVAGLIGEPSRFARSEISNQPEAHGGVATVAFESTVPTELADDTTPSRVTKKGADALPGNQRIANVVSKIAINLLFVLCIALGLLLLSKRFLKIDGTSSRQPQSQQNDLTVIQTLRLDSKTSIRLVQWRSNRFMIACDQNGIQSVHPLNPSFGQTLEELDQEKLDGKMIRILLDDLESKIKHWEK